MRPVICCTIHKGVFFGLAEDTEGDRVFLKDARMAIYWGTTRGVMELAHTGPTAKSKISAADKAAVKAVTEALIAHEEGHVQTAVDYARELSSGGGDTRTGRGATEKAAGTK